jgi:DNA invertase Pin-like site-specific DNA recombinase
MKVAYIRVSTKEQNEARQVTAMKAQGIEKLFIEKASGKDRKNRPELRKMIEFVREGDSVYIESISRLARSTYDFLSIVRELTEKGVEIVSLKEAIDTSTPQGKFMLTVFGGLYELERESIKERQAEGIAEARKSGVKFGRKKQEITPIFIAAYAEWKAGDTTAVVAMERAGMGKDTFYRRVKEYNEATK